MLAAGVDQGIEHEARVCQRHPHYWAQNRAAAAEVNLAGERVDVRSVDHPSPTRTGSSSRGARMMEALNPALTDDVDELLNRRCVGEYLVGVEVERDEPSGERREIK